MIKHLKIKHSEGVEVEVKRKKEVQVVFKTSLPPVLDNFSLESIQFSTTFSGLLYVV